MTAYLKVPEQDAKNLRQFLLEQAQNLTAQASVCLRNAAALDSFEMVVEAPDKPPESRARENWTAPLIEAINGPE